MEHAIFVWDIFNPMCCSGRMHKFAPRVNIRFKSYEMYYLLLIFTRDFRTLDDIISHHGSYFEVLRIAEVRRWITLANRNRLQNWRDTATEHSNVRCVAEHRRGTMRSSKDLLARVKAQLHGLHWPSGRLLLWPLIRVGLAWLKVHRSNRIGVRWTGLAELPGPWVGVAPYVWKY